MHRASMWRGSHPALQVPGLRECLCSGRIPASGSARFYGSQLQWQQIRWRSSHFSCLSNVGRGGGHLVKLLRLRLLLPTGTMTRTMVQQPKLVVPRGGGAATLCKHFVRAEPHPGTSLDDCGVPGRSQRLKFPVGAEPHPGADLSNCDAPGRSQCLQSSLADGAALGCRLTQVRVHPAARAVEGAALQTVLLLSQCCGQWRQPG